MTRRNYISRESMGLKNSANTHSLLVLTSDRDTMKFDPWAGELAVGDRNGFGVERIHARGENPRLTGQGPCLKFFVKLYDIGCGGHPENIGPLWKARLTPEDTAVTNIDRRWVLFI